jgi:hypothetical protein
MKLLIALQFLQKLNVPCESERSPRGLCGLLAEQRQHPKLVRGFQATQVGARELSPFARVFALAASPPGVQGLSVRFGVAGQCGQLGRLRALAFGWGD